MSETPRQLVFELPHRAALGAEDFLVSPANAAAVAIVDQWPNWPHWGVLVVGPEACGKSHLANVWRFKSGANIVQAGQLDEALIDRFHETRAIVVDDLAPGVADERILFHLLNLARQEKYSILLNSRVASQGLNVALPDLRSRLGALPVVQIEPPDEMLLQALLVKLFSDRQLSVDPSLIQYLAVRIDRSAHSASQIVETIDRLALETHRKVSRSLANTALEKLLADGST